MAIDLAELMRDYPDLFEQPEPENIFDAVIAIPGPLQGTKLGDVTQADWLKFRDYMDRAKVLVER